MALLVGADHPVPLVIFHLFGPDDAPRGLGDAANERKIRIEERIHEEDQYVFIHERLRQLHRAGRPILNLLDHVMSRDVRVRIGDIALDGLSHVTHHENDIVHSELGEVVEDVAHDRPSRDANQRLGRGMRVRAKTSTLSSQRNNRFHEYGAMGSTKEDRRPLWNTGR